MSEASASGARSPLPRWFVWRRRSGRVEGELIATVEADSEPIARYVGEKQSGREGHIYATPAPADAPLSSRQ